MTFVTEKEAAEKWCPLDHTVKASIDPKSNRCIGSKCMAWREVERERNENSSEVVARHENRVEFRQVTMPARGYCGAFGKVAS